MLHKKNLICYKLNHFFSPIICCRYMSFDFHHYCGNSNFDNLNVLYDQISEDFEKQG